MVKVLFVCLGNICRSPMAEGIFNDIILKKKLQKVMKCDSAGTEGYHVGEWPDKRMQQTAYKHQIHLGHTARQIVKEDIAKFDFILAMDKANLADILTLSYPNESAGKIMLIRDFDPVSGDGNVPDPYYGGIDGFEEVYQMLERCNHALINCLIKDSL
ncbi:MAG: low molecular weight protein-tyrosine-phosphatase [Bacteroidota bacterium]